MKDLVRGKGPWRGVVVVAVAALWYLPAAALLSLGGYDFGRELDPTFYSVSAGVFPVLLLALVVELAYLHTSLRQSIEAVEHESASALEDARRSGDEELLRRAEVVVKKVEDLGKRWAGTNRGGLRQVRSCFLTAGIGEAAALGAVATQCTTTFLFVVCAASIVTLGTQLLVAYEWRFQELP